MSIRGVSGKKKFRLVGQDIGGVLPQLGGVLHSGMPTVPGRSFPTFWAPPSGDQLKGATPMQETTA
jgi:hypothetical protein